MCIMFFSRYEKNKSFYDYIFKIKKIHNITKEVFLHPITKRNVIRSRFCHKVNVKLQVVCQFSKFELMHQCTAVVM